MRQLDKLTLGYYSMKIVVLSPAHVKSGGPELAHQFCYIANKEFNIEAYMCYVDINTGELIEDGMDESYKIYSTSNISNLDSIDTEENIVIIPEGLAPVVGYFIYAKVALWWMSVDNYPVHMNECYLDMLREKVSFHLVQSYYAKDYVEKKFVNPNTLFLTDYINETHGQFLLPGEYRKNVILYNPKKGKECLDKIITQLPGFIWQPIINLNVEQIVVLMQASKIYVDFGNHPGKDRIPREAAANGCCVITNKQGSAAYTEDVPIPEDYKFEKPQDSVEEIKLLIEDIFENFNQRSKDFDSYREWIKQEKSRFIEETGVFLKEVKSL